MNIVGCVRSYVVRALALAGVVIGLSASEVLAGPGGYCDAYAKHFAGRKTGIAAGAASALGSRFAANRKNDRSLRCLVHSARGAGPGISFNCARTSGVSS